MNIFTGYGVQRSYKRTRIKGINIEGNDRIDVVNIFFKENTCYKKRIKIQGRKGTQVISEELGGMKIRW